MAGEGKGSELLAAAAAAKRRTEEQRREEESPSTTLTSIDASLDNLNADLLLDILVRLPTAKSVFSCKLVSKRWRSLIEKPYFVSKFISHHITNKMGNNHSSYASAYRNLPSLFISRNRGTMLYFLRTGSDQEDGFTLESLPQEKDINLKFSVVAYCDDLLFCVARTKDLEIIRYYYICNPFTGQWRLLPPPPERMIRSVKYFGLVCEPNYQRWVQGQQYESRFRAICFSMEVNLICVDSFCSESGQWNESVLSGPQYRFFLANVVSHDGKLHWFNSHDVVAYDPFNEGQTIIIDGSECRLPQVVGNVPNNPNNHQNFFVRGIWYLLGVCQGLLRLMNISASSRISAPTDYLRVWELKDYETRRFCLVHLIPFNNMISRELWVSDFLKSHFRCWTIPIAFHPEKKDVVYLTYRKHIISCNIQSGELEVIDEIPYQLERREKVLPIKIPLWPTPISICEDPQNALL